MILLPSKFADHRRNRVRFSAFPRWPIFDSRSMDSCDLNTSERLFVEYRILQFELHACNARSIKNQSSCFAYSKIAFIPAVTVGVLQRHSKIEGEPWTFTARRSFDKQLHELNPKHRYFKMVQHH